MSVVGIDFGNLNTVVAVARNRGIDVITNEVSNRATPTLVSFGDRQRWLGESAKTQEVSNFKNTVSTFKRLLGRPASDPELQTIEKKFINARLSEGQDGEAAVTVRYVNEEHTFSGTQLAAMFFGKVKEFTAAEINLPVTDAVISVPGWYTDHQRRALLDACNIAGINCLRLMNELTASALGYGITKLDLPDTTLDANAKPRNVVFVDMGHSNFQVSVVSFVKGKLVVKGTAYDRNLGGRDLDELICQHFIKEFDAKYKMDIVSNPRAVFRLRAQCEKVKKILSANAVTLLNVESLLDDKDVSAKVSREEFESWAAPLVARIQEPLRVALSLAKLTPDEIHSVEVVGGSTRVPCVKDAIAKVFGGTLDGENKLSYTLNQDEAIARGCALQCAILSPVFKVRDFSISDWNGYPVEVAWDASFNTKGTDAALEVFPVANTQPSSKNLTFYRAFKPEEADAKEVGYTITARYTDKAIAERYYPAAQTTTICEWQLSGIKKYDESGRADIRIKARLDANGIVNIENPFQQVVVEKTSPATPTQTQKVVEKHPLTLKLKYATGHASDAIATWQSAEGDMAAADRLVIDTAEKRNALEEYVYYARDKLDTTWREFCPEDARTQFQNELRAMEDWLYTEEGEEATKSVYAEKLAALKKQGDPIMARFRESEDRPIAERDFKATATALRRRAESEDVAHIEAAELGKVTKEVNDKLAWLNDKIAKQNETPKHAPLVITAAEIR
ncbi:heat shock protein 70, partial [Caulochytrium protostelioides]